LQIIKKYLLLTSENKNMTGIYMNMITIVFKSDSKVKTSDKKRLLL
jgi:hypothetical protein